MMSRVDMTRDRARNDDGATAFNPGGIVHADGVRNESADAPETLERVIEAALEAGAVQLARSTLSEAETAGTLTPARSAYLKARIALETGDLLAARAILVIAIDRAPENPVLRALLAEVMVAAGTAADARVVLGHMGRAPVNPPPPAATNTKTGADGTTDEADAAAPRRAAIGQCRTADTSTG